jgi:hypothetical protein
VSRTAPLLLVALLLAACKPSPPAPGLSAADREQVLALVAAAQKKADAYKAARARGLREALQELDVPTAGGPCAEKLPRPPPLPDEDTPQSPADKEAFEAARWRMNVVPAWAVLDQKPPEPLKMMQKIEADIATKGPRRDQFDRQSEMLLKMAQSTEPLGSLWTRDEVLKLAREIGEDVYWPTELDVVAKVDKEAQHDASDTFEPGFIAGKALLWSFTEGRVICAAPVVATNQERIKLRVNVKDTSTRGHQRLHDDLRNEAYRAAIEALRAVPAGEKAGGEKGDGGTPAPGASGQPRASAPRSR